MTGHYCTTGPAPGHVAPQGEVGALPALKLQDTLGAGTQAQLQHVCEGRDPGKDQSYFLAAVREAQLQGVWFPVGQFLKSEVRAMAYDLGLPNAARKDSQGICFLGKVDINRFLAQYIPEQPGPILHAEDGRELGRHQGLHNYTIGQRKGIGVPSNADHQRYVVVGKDYERGALLIAFESTQAPGLWTRKLTVGDVNCFGPAFSQIEHLQARTRYRDPKVKVCAQPIGASGNRFELHFKEPQRALASGQMVAFYDGSRLAGGAFYE